MNSTAKPLDETTYHVLEQVDTYVLEQDDNAPTFRLANEVNAASAEAAVRKHAETSDNGPGTYIAVPSRSWKPVTVTAETKTVLKLS